jgi:hypothetical protein
MITNDNIYDALVRFILNCVMFHSSCLSFCTNRGTNPRRIGDRLVWAVGSNDLTHWATWIPTTREHRYYKEWYILEHKKGCTRLAAASDKVYQLLANGWWFSPASSTTKTGRYEIAEILLKVSNISIIKNIWVI